MKLHEPYVTALRAAVEASNVLMEYYTKGFKSELKQDGSPVTEADLASSQIIREKLAITGIPVLDEEGELADYTIRQSWKQNWCVDPLDGTKEFIKKNGEFAVNIALIDQEQAAFGLITSPVRQEVILGGRGLGVYQFSFADAEHPEKWRKIEATSDAPEHLALIHSRSHLSKETKILITGLEEQFQSLRIIQKGSALKFFDLANNLAQVYPRFAPTMEWDIAAGQAILEELGGAVLDAQTKLPLRYNKAKLFNPHFVAHTKAMSPQMQPML